MESVVESGTNLLSFVRSAKADTPAILPYDTVLTILDMKPIVERKR